MTPPPPAPSLPGPSAPLRRRADGLLLLARLHQALSPRERRHGLLGFSSLAPDQGLLLPGVRMIHTFFMRMSLDVAFLSPDGTILDLHPRLPPWRIAFCRHPGRASTLETAPGAFQRWNLQLGDQLELTHP